LSIAATEYERLATALTANESVTAGQMFGKACLKVGGKAFVSLHKEKVVFKLTGEQHTKALALNEAELWDPSGKGRPMKEWIALPVTESKSFKSFANAALAYVASSSEHGK
jgi:hypothetical protein